MGIFLEKHNQGVVLLPITPRRPAVQDPVLWGWSFGLAGIGLLGLMGIGWVQDWMIAQVIAFIQANTPSIQGVNTPSWASVLMPGVQLGLVQGGNTGWGVPRLHWPGWRGLPAWSHAWLVPLILLLASFSTRYVVARLHPTGSSHLTSRARLVLGWKVGRRALWIGLVAIPLGLVSSMGADLLANLALWAGTLQYAVALDALDYRKGQDATGGMTRPRLLLLAALGTGLSWIPVIGWISPVWLMVLSIQKA